MSPATTTRNKAGLYWPDVWAVVFGALLCLALLKFGNPVLLDRLIEVPAEFWQFVFQPWPVRWGYTALIACAALGGWLVPFRLSVPQWVVLTPCLWFGWQVLASATTVDSNLTRVTLVHFGACLVCFFLGLTILPAARRPSTFWVPILVGFALVIWVGFDQHYGSLEETRKMFYQQPDWKRYPPEYIKRIESNRIFSTMVYPNALAGTILLLLPPLLVVVWRVTARLTTITRGVLTGGMAYVALACLFWSGSKSGWLIALVLVLALVLRQGISKQVKAGIIGAVIVLGLAGFFIKFAPYFRRGAPSVSARFQYWTAGVKTVLQHPIFGTGPGTFSVAYRQIKPPEAEMAQLVHNDYLEQASDSGVAGCLAYSTFIIGSLAGLARRLKPGAPPEWVAVWLGLLGWSLQSFVEFLLYIPALAWTAFVLLGWLWAKAGGGAVESVVPERSTNRGRVR